MAQSPTGTPLVLSNQYLPSAYNLHLQIHHVKPNFQGQVSIPLEKNTLHSDRDSFELVLHGHKLIITKAELHTVKDEAHKLTVSYDRAAQTTTFTADCSDEPVQVDITFMGSITAIKTFKDETYGIFKTNYSDSIKGQSDNYVIATHTQPFGCRTIFPVVDELFHKVPIALTITTKSSFKCVSNSMLESVKTIDLSENSVFTFKPTKPIATSVFGFVLGDLECVEAQTSVPVRAYVTKGDSAEVKYALKTASTLLPLFEEVLGVPYPLEKFDLVTLPFLSDTVMENWGMVTVMRNNVLFDEKSGNADIKRHVRQLISHQLTHQWVGNLVSFDDWKYTWLIEAFATFVGDYVLSKAAIASEDSEYLLNKSAAIQEMMDLDAFIDSPIPSIYEIMAKMTVNNDARTATMFEKHAYDKGMIILNMAATMLQNEKKESDFSTFFQTLAKVLQEQQYKAIKPTQMWGAFNEITSYDFRSFIHSWTRYPGYPYLKVKVNGEKIRIEQNRFLYNDSIEKLELENAPFHVPLGLKVLDEKRQLKFVNLMLNDRYIDLELPVAQFVSLNANNQFFFRAVYSSEIQAQIIKNVSANVFTPLDLVGMIKDYGQILGQPVPENDSDMFSANQLNFLMDLCNTFTEPSWNLDYEVLKCVLTYIEIVNSIFVHFTEYEKFEAWLSAFSSKMLVKVGNWDKVVELTSEDYHSTEYQVRNILLQLAQADPVARSTCKKLYKNFLSSGVSKKFTPRELYSSMFNVTIATANMAEYKQVLALVKNANTSYLNHSNGSAQEVQTAAVSSLAFSQKQELLAKTLHFVNANIDSKMIELSLIGFKYHHSPAIKQAIWAWYKVNYDNWVKRSLRKGSDWSKQIGVTAGNITRLVLGEVMQYKPEEVQQFVEAKLKSLPPHQLKERYSTLEEEIQEKQRIALYYRDLFGGP